METMIAFGRPSRVKDLIGIAVLSLTVALLWVESSLAAGGSAAVAPEAADVVEVVPMTTTAVAAPAGVDRI
jgi:hypothetical protein